MAAVSGILLAEYLALDPRWLAGIALLAALAARRRGGTPALLLAFAAAFAAVHTWQWRENPARIWAAEFAPAPREVRITGVIIDEPQQGESGAWRAPLLVESWSDREGQSIALPGRIVARWKSENVPRYGDRWEITGRVSMLPPPRNPGEFDAAEWWGRRGVYLEMRANPAVPTRLLERGLGSPVKSAALAARAWMLHTLGLGLPDAPALRALIAGVTLGARDTQADEFAEAFRLTGTFHLFSVSGLHVGMVALLLWLVLRPLGLGRRRAVLVIIPSLFFYALITGASPPSVRAAVMLSVAFAGFLLDREISPANGFAAAALLILGYDTNQLFSAGFQMSFSIVAAIFLLAPPLQEFFAERLRPDPFLPRRLYNRWQQFTADAGRGTAVTLGVSAAAWLGSLPLTIAVFHLVPLLAIPANMVAVPLAFGILSISMLALLGGAVSVWLAAVFNNASWGLAALLVAVVESTASLPGSYLRLPPGWMQPPAQLTVFDLGEGGAQFLRTRESAWLFDAGSETDFRRVIEPVLHAAGVMQLDALVLTHGDADHIGGAFAAMDAAAPRRFVESMLRDRSPTRKKIKAALAATNRGRWLAQPGDLARAGPSVNVRFLAPDPRERSNVSDDQALVAMIEMEGFRVLLLSDTGAAVEENLRRRYGEELRCDVLVFGRHENDVIATEPFLRATRPAAIVLNRADPFRDGTDEPALRQRLAASGAEIFDQEKTGAVILTARRPGLEIRGYLDKKVSTITAR